MVATPQARRDAAASHHRAKRTPGAGSDGRTASSGRPFSRSGQTRLEAQNGCFALGEKA
jgi:hypothetical protein